MADTATLDAEAPALTLKPTEAIQNPVIDDSNIKAMAARFRQEYAPATAKPKPEDQPDPSKMAPPPKTAEPPKPESVPKAQDAPKSPAQAAPEDDGIPPADTTVPLSRQNWQKLHASRNDVQAKLQQKENEAKEALTKAQQYEQELSKLKVTFPADIEALRAAAAEREKLAKEHAQLLEMVETTNLERSPRFQNWWSTETKKHLGIAARHVPADKRAELEKLLMEAPSTERNEALDALIEPLPNTSKRLINGAMEQLELVKIQREEALTRGSEQWKRLQEVERQEQLKAEQETNARREAITNRALEYARKLPSFQADAQKPETADEVRRNEAWVRSVVSGQVDEETATMIPAAAVEYLRLSQKEIPRLQAEIDKRDALIKQLQQASPSPSGGKGGTKQPEAPEGQSFAAKVKQLMQR